MPTGAPLLPVTKVGAGEKERAYVVRQNLCLKVLLGIVLLLSVISTLLVCTTYEVRVQRRHALIGAKNHREEEHASHMRVMRLSMALQRHLQDEVHDGELVQTYRAWLMRSVGDYQLRVLEKASSCNLTLRDGIKSEGVQFDQEVNEMLKDLMDDIVKEGAHARKGLKNITQAIMHELREDAIEETEFEHLMNDAGEDPGKLGYHAHEVKYRGHIHEDGEGSEYHHGHGHHHREHHGENGEEEEEEHHDDAEEHGGEHDDEDDDEDDEHHHHDGYHDDDDDDEQHMAGALEELAKRLQKNDSVIVISNETLAEWVKLHDVALQSLSDEEQEVDMERIGLKIQLAINASHAAPSFNQVEDDYDSEVDYLGSLIHKARIAPFRDELLALLASWEAGEVRISTPLKRIEQLIDDDVLSPDVLMLHGDYEFPPDPYD